MANMGKKLRDLIDKGEHFITGDTFSAITGRIVEYAGFPAAYLGGHACSAFHYAVPDNGVFSQVEQIEQASRIANVINIPLIADADTLGETVADAYHFTRRYIQQGIAGFHVEDERNPKHSKHVNGLWSIADQQARIDAARRAQRDSGQDFVIIARCDELYTSEMGGGGTGSSSSLIPFLGSPAAAAAAPRASGVALPSAFHLRRASPSSSMVSAAAAVMIEKETEKRTPILDN